MVYILKILYYNVKKKKEYNIKRRFRNGIKDFLNRS